MNVARVTSRGRTMIPKSIRDRCGIGDGDLRSFGVEDGLIVVRKLDAAERDYLMSLDAGFSEWLSPEDEEA
jgi:AbrB family looped-hinge helix DNA binding protein